MVPKRLTTRAGLALLATAAIAIAGATAVASVTVYENKFARKADVRELRKAEGKHCKKGWRRRSESLRIAVERGPELCGYRPPIEGDTNGPDHDFRAREKVLRSTPKAVRRGAFLAIAVRFGKGSGYQLRVFPSRHKFTLERSPSGGGAGFPAQGRSSSIKGLRKPNILRLIVVDNKVTARVNGAKVANVTDSNPAQVRGRGLEVAIGHRRTSRKEVIGDVDNLELRVPNP
jgi:hypothetical protein